VNLEKNTEIQLDKIYSNKIYSKYGNDEKDWGRKNLTGPICTRQEKGNGLGAPWKETHY